MAFARSGAYSLMNSAVSNESGKAKTIATRAIEIVPVRTAAIPTTSLSGFQADSVKKPKP